MRRKHITGSLALYVLLCLILTSGYISLLNPDAVAYFSIARTMQNMSTHALGAYWSPLLPFLIMLLERIHVDPLLAVKIITLGSGFILLSTFHLLSTLFPMRDDVHATVSYAMSIAIFSFGVRYVTPDLLYAASFALYLFVLFSPRYRSHWGNSALCGILNGIGYLAKGAAFPIFLAHFAMTNGYYAWRYRTERKKIFRHTIIGFLSFFVIAMPWITVISQTTNQWTFSTAGHIIYASKGPDGNDLHMGKYGLIPPPWEGATSVWADPSIVELQSWNPLDSWRAFIHQLKMSTRESVALMWILLLFSVFSFATLLGSVLLRFSPWQRHASTERIGLSLFTGCLFAAAYLPVVVSDRYFWPIYLLLVLLSAHLISFIIQEGHMRCCARWILICCLAFSFIGEPTATLILQHGRGDGIQQWSEATLKLHSVEGKRIATDWWKVGLIAAHFFQGDFYGQPKGNTASVVEKELLAHDIDYYIVWGDLRGTFTRYEEVESPDVHRTNPRLFRRL